MFIKLDSRNPLESDALEVTDLYNSQITKLATELRIKSNIRAYGVPRNLIGTSLMCKMKK